MGQYGLTRWPEIIASLNQPVFFQQNGTLILWHRQDAAEAHRFAGLLQKTQQQIDTLAPLEQLDAPALAQREPALANRFTQGLYLPEEGQLDNRQLLNALVTALEQHQVKIHWHSEQSPLSYSPGQKGQPDWVFDCRGLGSRQQWSQLRGVRGEVVRLCAPDVTLQRPTRLIHPRYPIYIAPKENHLFVIGATEIESEDLSEPSVRSTLELLSAAYTVHSGFAEARILEIATQARPTLRDNLPAIRWLTPRTMQINGLYRHGFMISPAILDTAIELFEHGQSDLAQQLDIKVEHA
jgi:glycine oxidase